MHNMSEGYPTPTPPPAGEQHEADSQLVGLQILEAQYGHNPEALGVNMAMTLAAALRMNASVLRTNHDQKFLGTGTTDIITQGYQRLLHPEATNFPTVYGTMFEKLVPSSSSAGSLALLLAGNLEERVAYHTHYPHLSNEDRYTGRAALLSADAQLCIGLEKVVEDYLSDYITSHKPAPKELFHPEVLDVFCEKTLRSAPVVRTVRGLATSSLLTHKRTTGLSTPARTWLRTRSGYQASGPA